MVDKGCADDGNDWVLIEGRNNHDPELSQFVSQQIARELVEFELSTRSYATAPFMEGHLWIVQQVDRENLRVKLSRKHEDAVESPPIEGFLRPQSLRGNQSIYLRRRNLLNRLEDDPYLLQAISENNRKLNQEGDIDRFFNPDLDEGKQSLVKRIMKTGPLFVVQGPPGTGKTTLATEVIRQTLHRCQLAGTSGRILVTSQSHAPLNHLLQEVNRALEEQSNKHPSAGRVRANRMAGSQPVIIRLGTEGRTSTSDADGRGDIRPPSSGRSLAGDDDVARFHPAAVSRTKWGESLTWEPAPHSLFPRSLLNRWRQFLRESETDFQKDLQERLRRTANLVFVTANDREIYKLGEDSVFDLLIYEEAAKAYPLEVLAPMMHARRWLLIGDQHQLPPFNIESFSDQLEASFRDLAGRASLRTPGRKADLDRLQLNDQSLARAHKLVHFFEYLFNLGEAGGFADRLRMQWRMHPEIGNLLRKAYYEFLQNGNESYLRQNRVHPIIRHPCSNPPNQISRVNLVWIDTPLARSNDAISAERPYHGGGYRNYYEGHAIFQFLRQVETRRGGFDRDILLLSPYRSQVQLLKQFFRSWTRDRNRHTGDLRDLADTVDSAQGREAAVVIVSLVRNNSEPGGLPAFGFLESAQRSGVMFSRAESLLIVVGCSDHFAKNPDLHINQVFQYIEQSGMVIDARSLVDAHSQKMIREHDTRRRQNDGAFYQQ